MSELPVFTLIRSRRRTISLHITQSGAIEVKAPYLAPMFVINQFVRKNSVWIQKHQSEVSRIPHKKNGKIKEGDKYFYLGKLYPIHFGDSKQISVTDRLNIPRYLVFRIKKELTDWYIHQAKKIITERVLYHSTQLKADFRRITFSDTTSKWGSCSHDNALQFSWRLVMAPLLVIDYVVTHELIHTSIKNHSSKFWKEVSLHKPAYKQYIKWLRQNSRQLHASP